MLANYLKTAFAVFRRRKFFTFVSLFGISFTLAVLLVATAMIDHVFGAIPPEVDQNRSLGLISCRLSGDAGSSHTSFSYTLLDRNLRNLPGAEKVSIFSFIRSVTSFVDERRVESYLKFTDAEFFEILAFDFVEGRPFTHDEVANGAAVVVINRATRDRFFPDSSAVGELIEADGQPFRVVGVVENVPFFRLVPFADMWAPLSVDAKRDRGPAVLGSYGGLILASDRSQFQAIRDEFVSRMAAVDLSVEGDYDTLVAVPETPFQLVSRMIFAQGRSTESHATELLLLVVTLMVMFMVLPTINLVNLNLSRIMERASEIGVRKAFGAPTLTLIGQFVIENVLLTLAGGIVALVLARLALDAVGAAGLIPYASFHLNTRVLGYALLIALFFGLMSGVYPAWRMSRMHPVDALRGGAS